MSDPVLFDVPSRPVDAERRAILELIAGDPIHAKDRDAIVAAILYVAAHNAGKVDPNIVRARLCDPWGVLQVYPRVVGAVYSSLASRGVLAVDGWVISTDRKGGNYGKPCRTYKLRWSAAA